MKKKTSEQLDLLLAKHQESYPDLVDKKDKGLLRRMSVTEKFEYTISGIIWPVMKEFETQLQSKGHKALISQRMCSTSDGREYTGAIKLAVLPSGLEGEIGNISNPHIEFFLDEDVKKVFVVTQISNLEGRTDYLASVQIKLNRLNAGKVEFYLLRGIKEIFKALQ